MILGRSQTKWRVSDFRENETSELYKKLER